MDLFFFFSLKNIKGFVSHRLVILGLDRVETPHKADIKKQPNLQIFSQSNFSSTFQVQLRLHKCYELFDNQS
jgi:hypothetical protein